MHRINDVIQLWLGIQGENKSRTIEIDMTDWIVGMPNGSPSIWIKRPGDATPTATGATFDMVTNLLTWKPDEVDTYVAGEGTAEIRMTEGTVIKKTKEIRIAVSPAVTGGGTTLGSDWQSYINEVDRLKSLATAAATAAGASEEAAETAAEEAETARDTAVSAKNAADASATAAAESAATARQAASVASGAATAAQNYKDQALSASGAAQTAQSQAESYKNQAQSSASNAQTAESHARTYASNASSSASQAQSSASQAAGNAATANSAANQAETARNAAEQAKAAAIEAKTAAVSAGNTATKAKTAAETAATAAEGSATAAAGSATSAAADAETAEDAKDAAVAAKTAAEAARDVALTMIDDTAGAGDTDKAWSADKSTKEVTDLKSAIDEKADVICKTIDTPASIITIEDGADDLPVKEMKIAIEPVQDLHGYENPWPGGGGKNLNEFAEDRINTSKNVDFTASVGSHFTASGTANGTNATLEYTVIHPFTFVAGTKYIFSFTGTGVNLVSYVFLYDENKTGAGTIEITNGVGEFVPESNASASFIRIRLNTADGTVVSVDCNWQVEIGNSATAWSPYSNICPISGWTGANVTRTGYGVNLFDTSKVTLGKWIQGGGTITNLNQTGYGEMIPVFSDKYSFKVFGTENKYNAIAEYNENKQFIRLNVKNDVTEGSVTLQSNTKYIVFECGKETGKLTKADIDAMQIMLCAGDVPTEFKAYDSTYSITFPSEAGTVYGGTLTIHQDGTGELMVDRAWVDLGSLTWEYTSSNRFNAKNITNMKLSALRTQYLICSCYKTNVGGGAYDDKTIYNGALQDLYIVDTNYSDVTSFTAFVTGQTVVCPLEVSVHYSLTAPQVRTLLGLNHIFADAGDIESITYPVDTAIALDNQTSTTHGMIAESDSSVATESHVVGDVFICDNKLYKATAAIAVGESIIEGSNVEQTTIADELNAIWGSIATGVSF